MHRLIFASEQHQAKMLSVGDHLKPYFINKEYVKVFRLKEETELCFRISHESGEFLIDSSYFIGADWIVQDEVALYIEPKLNDGLQEIDFLGMLMESLDAPENFEHLNSLFDVDYNASWLTIPQKKDLLSPLLIVQFLKLLQSIVKKGLKKSYYTIQTNLTNKIKGKVLVGRQIKENVLKNRLTKTVCEYQEFGFNFEENKFLKTVLSFVKTYVYQSNTYFSEQQKSNLIAILNFCSPAFHTVEELENLHGEIKIQRNVFYKDYQEAFRIGQYILKRFSYNVSRTSSTTCFTPPFWIDMSKLFELFVFKKLKYVFPSPDSVTYHDRFMGRKETDILIKVKGYESVVDCKYKPQYKNHSPSLEDKRQLAGYTRLKGVYKKLNLPYDQVVKGLIVFSHQSCPSNFTEEEVYKERIEEYISFYKLGISLPVV